MGTEDEVIGKQTEFLLSWSFYSKSVDNEQNK